MLTSHAGILDTDRGHIFRNRRHKNNKKVTLIYEKTVRTGRYYGIFPPVVKACMFPLSMHNGVRMFKTRFPRALCVRAI